MFCVCLCERDREWFFLWYMGVFLRFVWKSIGCFIVMLLCIVLLFLFAFQCISLQSVTFIFLAQTIQSSYSSHTLYQSMIPGIFSFLLTPSRLFYFVCLFSTISLSFSFYLLHVDTYVDLRSICSFPRSLSRVCFAELRVRSRLFMFFKYSFSFHINLIKLFEQLQMRDWIQLKNVFNVVAYLYGCVVAVCCGSDAVCLCEWVYFIYCYRFQPIISIILRSLSGETLIFNENLFVVDTALFTFLFSVISETSVFVYFFYD